MKLCSGLWWLVFLSLGPFLMSSVAQADTAQSVCVSLFVGTSTDLGTNCVQQTPTTTPTTTPETPPITSTPVTITGSAALPNVSNVSVSYQGTAVIITWDNPIPPTRFAGVRIVRSPYDIPTDPFSGKVVYQGGGTYVRDTGGVAGTVYYYTAFSYDALGNYSSGTVFGVLWPSSQPSLTGVVTPPTSPLPPSLFPSGSTFPPLTSSSSLNVFGPLPTRPSPFEFSDLLFVQNGRILTQHFLPNPATPTTPTYYVDVVGNIPVVVAVRDSRILEKVPDGLTRALMSLNILGKQQNYLLRHSPSDQDFETQLDLSRAPEGGYPFVIEFWPSRGEPFALTGLLMVTQPARFTNLFGFTLTTFEWWLLLLLLVLFIIFVVLLHWAHRNQCIEYKI